MSLLDELLFISHIPQFESTMASEGALQSWDYYYLCDTNQLWKRSSKNKCGMGDIPGDGAQTSVKIS